MTEHIDPRLATYLDELRRRPAPIHVSVMPGATKEQIEAIVKMVESMQGDR